MAGSSSDESIFLTQNTYSDIRDSDSSVEDLFGYINNSQDLDKCTHSISSPCTPVFSDTPVASSPYMPVFSDISDNEIDVIATFCDNAEHQMRDEPTAEVPVTATTAARFDRPRTDCEIAAIQTKKFSDATMNKLRWAVKTFNEWKAHRNTLAEGMDISPIRVELHDMTKDELNYAISRFICEVKKVDGSDYPSDTMYSFVISLQLHMSIMGKDYKFLNDEAFAQIKNTLDNTMKEKSRNHVGGPRKQAEVISPEEEEVLWESGSLGSDTPDKLVNTMLYIIGLNFALRGGQEHRYLRRGATSQITIGTNDAGSYLMYTEDVSKSNQGGLKHRKVEAKRVIAYGNSEHPERCVVRLFEKYCSLCPPIKNTDALYLRPLVKLKQHVWFADAPLGRHKLAGVVAAVCKSAGLPGYRTNHSLRASAASRMYQAGMDEQLICDVTGHRSAAVRNYKRTTNAQKRQVSDVVQGGSHGSSTSTATGACTCKKSKTDNLVHCEKDESHNDRNVSFTVNIKL